MTVKGRDFFREPKAVAPPPPPVPLRCCAAPYCLAEGRFGFKPPGLAGLRAEATFYCYAHRNLGEQHVRVS